MLVSGNGECWLELGEILVSFGYGVEPGGSRRLQTRARNTRTGSEQCWAGLATEQLHTWILAQAATLMPSDTAEPAGFEPLDLELVDLTLDHIRQASVLGPSFLRASGRLRIYDGGAGSGMGYRVEFVLVNLDTQQARIVAVERGSVRTDEFSRDVASEFALPSLGRYQLRAVVKKMPDGAVMAESPGPVLRVEA